jgi:hypothetical protein
MESEEEELDLGPIKERLANLKPNPRTWYMNRDYMVLCNNAYTDMTAMVAEIKRLREQSLKDRQAFTCLQMEMATGEDTKG